MKTSYYARLNRIDKSIYEPIAISGDEGKIVGFTGRAMKKLSPFKFYRKWKANEEMIKEMYATFQITKEDYERLKKESEMDYIRKFYYGVLSPQDPQKIYEELGENAVILCFERPTDFCHRFLVAGWLELSLGVEIDELGFENNQIIRENKNKLKSEIEKLMNQYKKTNSDEQN